MQPSLGYAEGAFAFGQYGNGGWASGTAYNHRTEAEAQITAMNNCNARGYNCSIRVTFRNTCFALAVQNNGSGFGYSFHSDINRARNDALARCAQYGLSCSVNTTFCDTVSEAAIREAEQEAARRREAAIREAEQETARRQNAEYQEYVRRWHICFDGSISEGGLNNQISLCNQALSFPRASVDDRTKLTQRRDNLILARENRERSARDAQERSRLAAEEAARQAGQLARNAEESARQAELRARNAELAARTAERNSRPASPPPVVMNAAPNPQGADYSTFLKKPVPEVTALMIFLFFLYAAIKETVKSRVPERYKVLAAIGVAAFEFAIYSFIGVSPSDPKIIDVVAMSGPLAVTAAGFGLFPRAYPA
jgi:hypothetical protein